MSEQKRSDGIGEIQEAEILSLEDRDKMKQDLINKIKIERAQDNIIQQQAEEIQRLQSKIDSLMLEYCPDDMTPEQLSEWEKHQKPTGAES